jgi:hypothetical protein
VFKKVFFLTTLLSLILTACPSSPKLSVVGSPGASDLQVGQSERKTFALKNSGSSPLEYTLKSSSPSIILVSKTSGTLAPNSQQDIAFQVDCPLIATTLSATISVSSSSGDGSVKVEATCRSVQPIPTPSTNYDVDLIFLGTGITSSRQAVFKEAAGLWSAVVVGDLQNILIEQRDIPATSDICGFPTPELPAGTLDDLVIFASIAPIDGPGKILGQAGPAFIRATTDDLPAIGCMQFDEADVAALEADGTFNEVILHEMGHVLGFGSLWEPGQGLDIDLLDKTCPGTAGTKVGFKGASAIVEFGVLGETGNPPIETNGGQGTQCSHWDEDFFDNELMTGFLGGVTSATVNPFSALTIASMKDMGYDVDLGEAEPYSIPACSPNCDPETLKTQADEAWEIILQPKGTVDSSGTVQLFQGQ